MIKLISKKNINFLILQLAIIVYSFVPLASKKASQHVFFSIDFIKYFIFIIIVLGLYAYIWQKILKQYEVSKVYSNRAIYIIWNMLWAVIFFNENIKFNNVLGSIIIICGIILVVKDDK